MMVEFLVIVPSVKIAIKEAQCYWHESILTKINHWLKLQDYIVGCWE
jgi:hypothetical protein